MTSSLVKFYLVPVHVDLEVKFVLSAFLCDRLGLEYILFVTLSQEFIVLGCSEILVILELLVVFRLWTLMFKNAG